MKLRLFSAAISAGVLLTHASAMLEALLPKASLPADCTKVCGDVASIINNDFTTQLTTAIMTLGLSLMELAGLPTCLPANSCSADVTSKLLKGIIPIGLDMVCKYQGNFTCLAQNCGTPSVNASKELINVWTDPRILFGSIAHSSKCLCQSCPGAKTAYNAMLGEVMKLQLSSIAFDPSKALANVTLQKELQMKMCSMTDMVRCFATDSSSCNLATSTGFGATAMTQAGIPSLADLHSQCLAAGHAPAARQMVKKVTTSFKIQNLDFAKVSKDQAVMTSIITTVKAKFASKMPGYTPEDFAASLSAGSVKADVELIPVPGSNEGDTSTATLNTMQNIVDQDTVYNEIVADVKTITGVSSTLKDGQTLDSLAVDSKTSVANSADLATTTTLASSGRSATKKSQNQFCSNRGGAGGSNKYSTNVGGNNLQACVDYVASTVGCGIWFNYGMIDGWCDCVPDTTACSYEDYSGYAVYLLQDQSTTTASTTKSTASTTKSKASTTKSTVSTTTKAATLTIVTSGSLEKGVARIMLSTLAYLVLLAPQ
jgi:hypothetical protein